jgi:hypothetical protein
MDSRRTSQLAARRKPRQGRSGRGKSRRYRRRQTGEKIPLDAVVVAKGIPWWHIAMTGNRAQGSLSGRVTFKRLLNLKGLITAA